MSNQTCLARVIVQFYYPGEPCDDPGSMYDAKTGLKARDEQVEVSGNNTEDEKLVALGELASISVTTVQNATLSIPQTVSPLEHEMEYTGIDDLLCNMDIIDIVNCAKALHERLLNEQIELYKSLPSYKSKPYIPEDTRPSTVEFLAEFEYWSEVINSSEGTEFDSGISFIGLANIGLI